MKDIIVLGWKSPQIGDHITDMVVIGECAPHGPQNGKILKSEKGERIYCNIQVGIGVDSYRVLVATDVIKPKDTTWWDMCGSCKRAHTMRA